MKICLFLPPVTRESCMNGWMMRLYMAYIYLVLIREKVRPVFYDHLDDEKGFLQYCSSIRRSSGDIWIVGMFLGNKKECLNLLKQARIKQPGATLIVVGPFAAAFYRYILERAIADIVVLSDPEAVIASLCRSSWSPVKIKNIAFLNSGKVICAPRKNLERLDSLPFAGEYFCQKKIYPVPVITTRGCRFSCSFCDRPSLWGGPFGMRSIENVLEEMRFLLRDYRAKKYVFGDADLTFDEERLTSLCLGLMDMPDRVSWSCSARVDNADHRMFRLMYRAGCEMVYFGVESGDPAILKKIGKEYGCREVVRAVGSAKEAGLKVGIFLTVGNPGETVSSLRKTKNLLLDLYPFSELTVNPLVVLPGTGLFMQRVRSGEIDVSEYVETDKVIFANSNIKKYMDELGPLSGFLESQC